MAVSLRRELLSIDPNRPASGRTLNALTSLLPAISTKNWKVRPFDILKYLRRYFHEWKKRRFKKWPFASYHSFAINLQRKKRRYFSSCFSFSFFHCVTSRRKEEKRWVNGRMRFRWQKLLARGLSAPVSSRNNRTVGNSVPVMHNVFIVDVGVRDKAVSLFTNHWIDWMKLHRCACPSRKLSIRIGSRRLLFLAVIELLQPVPLPPKYVYFLTNLPWYNTIGLQVTIELLIYYFP